MKKKPLYSGDSDNSRQFWDRVHALKDEKKRYAAYIMGCNLMGCNLQDIELRTFTYLQHAEEKDRKA